MKWILASVLLVSILGAFTCAGNQFFSHEMGAMGEECVFLGFVNIPIKQELFFFVLLLVAFFVVILFHRECKNHEWALSILLFYNAFFERITQFAAKIFDPLLYALRKGILCSQLYNLFSLVITR
jgi:hypothetical protein